jgi:HK97 gp10 family phage protein
MADFDRIPAIILRLEAAAEAGAYEGAKLVAERAKERVPVGKDPPHLKDAIHLEEGIDGVHVVAGNRDVFYGHIVEHGGVNHAPHPFLMPALEESKAEISALIAAHLKKAVG